MNILYCGDSNIANGVVLSVLSLMSKTKEQLNIYILTADVKTDLKEYTALSDDFAETLRKHVTDCNPENSVTLINVTDLFFSDLPAANLNTRFTPCCMLRLYADLVPEIPDKILYLDNDVLCRMDISEFYNQDISTFELAGVLDYYGKWFFHNNIFKFDYLNSGVLLLNMKKIRETGLFEKCRTRCREKEMFMPDQSAINKLSAHKKICERRYNEQRKLKDNTVLQHFTTSFRLIPWLHTVSVKPWEFERMHSVLKLHEYDGLFLEYEQFNHEIKKVKELSI